MPQDPKYGDMNPEDRPIINSPFEYPEYYWQLDSNNKAFAPRLEGRRESQNMPAVAGTRSSANRRITMFGDDRLGVEWERLELVNKIRERLLDWKNNSYHGATYTTLKLIDHWFNREDNQLYYAQKDAVLTHIYLTEIKPPDILVLSLIHI